MEPTPTGEEQPKEREKHPPEDGASGSATETVAPPESTELGTLSSDAKETAENKHPEDGQTDGTALLEKELDAMEEDSGEETFVIESSPEKQPSEKTKEDSVKSPGEEVFSIDDEEEADERPVDEEEEEEEEEVFDDMDEDEEIYVETTDRVDANELSDENSSESEISSDEYDEDDEGDQVRVGARKGGKSMPEESHRASNEQDNDDGDVQIVTDDDEMEEEEDNEPEEEEEDEEEEEEEEEDDDGDLDRTPEHETIVIRNFGPKYESDSSESLVEKSLKLRVKYCNYQRKLAAFLRKRTFKIFSGAMVRYDLHEAYEIHRNARLNKRSMHVMEDSSDALVVCSDANHTANLKQALVSSKEDAESLSVAKPPVEKPEITVQTTSITTTTTTTNIASDGSQSETKELDSVVKVQEGGKTGEHDTEGELSRDAISSTSDKMPTATAVEVVSEKIADSSDDALSVLSTKKSISAATTPSVNSSTSAEPGDGKAKESNADTTLEVVASKERTESETVDEPQGKDVVTQEEARKSPTVAAQENEPTADDVMEGIDDFMDHNGSEGKEQNGRDEDDFNEDLAFQMDVDEIVPGEKETVAEKSLLEESKGDERKEEGKGPGESAMDLTSTSEPQPSKQDRPVEEKESVPNATTSATSPTTTTSSVTVVDVVDCSPEKCNQRRASLATKEGDVNLRDKNIVTSTPIATGSEKRTESVQPSAIQKEGQATQVKREMADEAAAPSDETDERDEVQNLSTSKAPAAPSSSVSDEPTVPVQPTSRKRRRSVDRDGSHANAEPAEPIEPAKKLKLEVESNYQTHERVVNEYIEATHNTTVDEIECHINTLTIELQAIEEMMREKEHTWNNLLHMKKVKEEILQRLNRRKHVIDITGTRLGEVSVFNHVDSSNLSSQLQLNPHQQRSSSVGPRPPTPPPEVEIRPASVSTTNYSHNASNGGNSAGGKHSQISNRRNSSIAVGSGQRNTNNHSNNTSARRSASARDTNSFVSQFNSSNNAVTMVPLPNEANQILQARASMNAADMAKEKALALHVQRHLFPKPVLTNQQQILNNLAMSAGLTSLAAAGSGAGANNSSNASASTALLNGHHGPSVSSTGATSREQQQQQQQQQEQQLQIGRQGNRKFVTSIIDEFRQQHPQSVPRRGRRMKHVGGSSGGSNNGGMPSTSTGNSIGGTFGERGAISLTALPGGKSSAAASAARSSSTDSAANRLSELLAAAENSRPSSNDSSQSSSNLLSSLVSASGAAASSSSQQQFLKDVLVQFAKMSQNEQSLLSNLQLLANNAVLASTDQSTATTNTVSSPQQSPQFQQQRQQQQQQQTLPQLHASLLSKASLPEVTLHPVMNSTAHSDILGSHNAPNTLTGANLSAVSTSSNSLLHGILTKSASRPATTGAATVANNFNSFSPTLARLLTGPERMNAVQAASSSTVTSGALANLQTGGVISGLNLSKNNSEISITPVVGSNFQQTLLAQQQQQQQLQRLREQHLFKGESYLNIDDEADDSVDRLVIDEGVDMVSHREGISTRRVAEINENEVPQCQGCKKTEAKFVCAGCNQQWYCSRDCQVRAWEDHSEVCNG